MSRCRPHSTEAVARFERNMADHALYVYRCERCGWHWGRYLAEEKAACVKCGEMPERDVMVVEPESLISAWLNNGKMGKSYADSK